MLLSTAGTWARLRSRITQREGKDASSYRSSLADLEDRLRNMRQFMGAALYLFALIFFIWLPHDIRINETGLGLIRGILSLHFAFGANVFFVLLVLHAAQWLLSSRVAAARRRLAIH
jgi:hypothetical protein